MTPGAENLPAPEVRRRRVWWIVGGLALVLLLAGGIVGWQRRAVVYAHLLGADDEDVAEWAKEKIIELGDKAGPCLPVLKEQLWSFPIEGKRLSKRRHIEILFSKKMPFGGVKERHKILRPLIKTGSHVDDSLKRLGEWEEPDAPVNMPFDQFISMTLPIGDFALHIFCDEEKKGICVSWGLHKDYYEKNAKTSPGYVTDFKIHKDSTP